MFDHETGEVITLTIDSEFEQLIPPLSDDERTELRASLEHEGCRDALVVWNNTIIDGHNRYALCHELGIPFKTVTRNFESRDDAMLWIIRNQFARRNLTPYVRAQLALKAKPLIAAQAKAQQVRKPESVSQNSVEQNPIDTQKQLASIAHVSHDTIHKVETVERDAPEPIKQKARSGELSVNRAYILTKSLQDAPPDIIDAINELNIDEWDRAFQQIKTKEHKPLATHQLLTQSDNNEWYTPAIYIDAARKLMGSIDMDPASCEYANQLIKATNIYTIETDGLSHNWNGNIWLNPPYGRDSDNTPNQKLWSEYLTNQYKAGNISQAVLLVNAVTDRSWFQPLWDYPICFVEKRIKFHDDNMTPGQPTHGNVFVYFGDNVTGFIAHFKSFGRIVIPSKFYQEHLSCLISL